MLNRRLTSRMAATVTIKHIKTALREEGVDPDKVSDPVYWLQDGHYVPFTRNDWEALKAGKVKL
jgi:hypothetical protein